MAFLHVVVLYMCVTAVQAAAAVGGKWNYRLDGPAHWKATYPACGGSNQSPINIDTSSLNVKSNLKVEYKATSAPLDISVFNSGMNVEAMPLRGVFEVNAPCAWEDHKPSTWVLNQFHWHWGGNNAIGSEHTVDRRRFPMEMHLVFFNKEYTNLWSAVASDNPNALLVLGFFIDTSLKALDNSEFQKIVGALQDTQHKENFVSVPSFDLYSFIEQSAGAELYYYQGSLTTPACNEAVTWIVHDQPIMVSETQIDAFRHAYFPKSTEAHPNQMVDNFRPTQDINARVVYTSKSTSDRPEFENLLLSFINRVAFY